MLGNTSMDQDSPLACLLVGQPTLRRTMKLAVLAALEQRTSLRYTMPGMTQAETASYIAHHVSLAQLTELPEEFSQVIGVLAILVAMVACHDQHRGSRAGPSGDYRS